MRNWIFEIEIGNNEWKMQSVSSTVPLSDKEKYMEMENDVYAYACSDQREKIHANDNIKFQSIIKDKELWIEISKDRFSNWKELIV